MSERVKTSIRLRGDLLNKMRQEAERQLGDKSRWRELLEEAMKDYLTRQLKDTDIALLLSKTEEALFNRLYNKIEHEFTDMTRRTVNRVGNLIAVSSYDVALTAIMTEEFFKERYSEKYYEARKLAAERMKKRWNREGADEIQLIISEKAEAENEARALREQVEQLKQQIKKYSETIEKAKRMILEQQQASKETKELKESYGEVIHWTRGLIEHLEQSSMLTSPSKAVEEYKRKHPRPEAL